MLSRLALALAVCAAATGILASPAAAAGEPDSGAFNAFNLKGSNGYRIQVWAGSQKGYRHGQVLAIVNRRRQAVLYFAPARVTDTEVDADLGAFGEIDVSFQPSGEQGVEHPVCDRSQRVTYDKGSYVGSIDLHGEEGYTRARATSVPLALHPYIDLICGGSGSGELVGRGLPGARLRARAKFAEGESIELQVGQNRPGARAMVTVSTNERRDRVRISRETSLAFPGASFDFGPSLGAAFFSPSAPFSGSALYLRNAKPANRWTGNLAVDLPGRSNVSLVGARFDVSLVRARLTRGRPSTDGLARPNLTAWPSTKPSPIAFATPSLLAPR